MKAAKAEKLAAKKAAAEAKRSSGGGSSSFFGIGGSQGSREEKARLADAKKAERASAREERKRVAREKREAAKASKAQKKAGTVPIPASSSPAPEATAPGEPQLDTILHQPPSDDSLAAAPGATDPSDMEPPQSRDDVPAEPAGLIGNSMAAAAERAALESLEQSEAADPIEVEADRRVAQAAAAFEPNAPDSGPEVPTQNEEPEPEPVSPYLGSKSEPAFEPESEQVPSQSLDEVRANVAKLAGEAAAEAEARVRAEAERSEPERSRLVQELQNAELQLEGRKVQEQALAAELRETELRLIESQQRTAEALERAAERLEDVESRAAEAEARVARAERLAKLKSDEIERGQRLRELLDRISDAEQRATDSEQRAKAVVDDIFDPAEYTSIESSGTLAVPFEPAAEEPDEAPASEPEAEVQPEPESISEPEPEPDSEPEPEPAPEQEAEPEQEQSPAPAPEPQVASPAPDGDPIDLNSASYEDLRNLGMSVTQTGRVLAFREREGSFKSLSELDSIAGFPRGFLDDLKSKIQLR